MSWDITTKEKALFEKALDGENLSWEEPLLDDSGDYPETGEPDIAARPPNLEEEANSPMNEEKQPRRVERRQELLPEEKEEEISRIEVEEGTSQCVWAVARRVSRESRSIQGEAKAWPEWS